MEYNAPNTRERVAARRRQRRRKATVDASWRPTRPASVRSPAMAAPVRQAIPRLPRTLLAWLQNGRLVSLTIFLTVSLAMAYLLTSPQFSVQRIEVEGEHILDEADVAAQADILGRPIWFVRPDVVVARLIENAYIASASVELALPDLVRIRIVERRPEVRWQAGGVQYLVDAGGKVLGPAQEAAPAEALVVADTHHPALKPNDQLDPDAVRLAQELALRLPVELGFTPSQIGWDYGLGVFVRGPLGQTIVFGRSEHLERKLAVLNVLLQDQTAFTYLDLRPSNPFYQNRAPASPGPSDPSEQ